MDMLDPLDSLMLTAELVSSPMHVAALMVMRPPPGEDADGYVKAIYEETLTAAVDVDRRLRRVPHTGVDTGFMWVWRDIADAGGEIDIRHHFQRRTLPKGGDMDDLWAMVSDLHALRLERSSPLWMAYLIDGLPEGRFAFYIKVHHIVVDGVAGLQMITDSLSTDPTRLGMPPFFAAKAAGTDPKPIPKDKHKTPALPSALRRIADIAASGMEQTDKVVRTQLATAVGSLLSQSIVAPFSAPQTRFNAKLGPYRAVAGTSLDRARVRAVQEAAGVSGNDVVMTIIGAALRNWLTERDELPQRSLVALCPVTVRKPGTVADDIHGNQFGMGLCPLGTDVGDDAERLNLVHDGMTAVKNQVAQQGPAVMLAALGPAIGPTILLPLLPFDTKVPPSFNVPVSNVPGPQEQMYFNGAHVDELYPVSTVWDGIGLNVTVCSYADRISVGYVADRDLMADIKTIIPLTDQALDDVERALDLAQ
ncbi:MAG: wax ester/triacylglycerol synthase family O-acyltransferase [Mycobacterium sp.]